jgi:hypothetical protein
MLNLLFCGDTVATPDNAELFARGDVDSLFADVAPLFRQADRVIVNLECALTNADRPIRKCGPNLKGPPESARTLARAGITDCALANNHMLDFGVDGMRDTLRALEDARLGWFGAGENEADSRRELLVEKDGLRVAVLAVAEHEYSYALPDQPGATPFDPFDTLCDVARLKQTYDAVVVLYHGGKEHCEYPSPRLRKACQAMARMGADLVLCQHSHIIGCAETHGASTILYGQGNFHFVRSAYAGAPGWNAGLMVHAAFSPHLTVAYTPVVAGKQGIRLAQGDEKQALLDGFAARSQRLADGGALAEWTAFCQRVKETYLASVRDAFSHPDDPQQLERFAHYLDCEAHTDVYRTLFPTWHAAHTDGAAESTKAQKSPT